PHTDPTAASCLASCGTARSRHRPARQRPEGTRPVGRPLGRTGQALTTHYSGKNDMTQLDKQADTHTAMLAFGQRARAAARLMRNAAGHAKARALLAMADLLEERGASLKRENALDLEAARRNGLAEAMVDRLVLTDKTLSGMAQGLRQIAAMPDPVGSTGPTTIRPNGMRVAQMRVPLGVIGIIYESRPNVTIDAAALCLKSGNATILRGGSEAFHSNQALGAIIQEGLKAAGLPEHAVQVVDTTDRAAVGEMVTMTEYIDVIVPRGGKGLIERLSREAKVPLIKHLDGNCHVYLDKAADPAKAHDITVNAK